MSPAYRQLAAALALRCRMVRSGPARAAGLVLALLVAWLSWVLAGAAPSLDAPTLAAAVEVAPSAFLGFAVLAMIAPLTTAGGLALFPSDQLVAFPVRAGTAFLGGLVLAPLNLVWVVHLLVLAGLTGCLTLDGSPGRGTLTTVAFVACATVLGQLVAWGVIALRRTCRGRRLVHAAAAGLAAGLVTVVHSGRSGDVLAASPTRHVVAAVSTAEPLRWAVTTGVLLALALTGVVAGIAACSSALRRPEAAGGGAWAAPVRRRAGRAGVLRELVAVDRASVWRAPALRRGAVVMAFLPGLAAAGAAVPWDSMIVLPGLVAAGAGLLFGVNAFALDGSGALWLASLPHDPAQLARAKAIVLTETVAAAVALAVLTGSLRSPGSPTSVQISAILGSALACTALVVAQCMGSSVRRPQRAELRGPRDAIAAPGALAAASLRLALPAAGVGMCTAAVATLGSWWMPAALAVAVLAGSALWLARSLRRYADPKVRAGIVQAVAAG